MRTDFSFLDRKKRYDTEQMAHTNLSRVLNLVDISAIGISCTMGAGIYILVGDVARNYSGPGILLSFLIAGCATLIAGLCYAELGSKVPRSGSAYVYIYVTIGEFVAFIIGWDMILECLIGNASTASALSGYIDSLTNYKIRNTMQSLVGNSTPPDFLGSIIIILVMFLLIIGVKESSFVNICICAFNIAVLTLIMITGLTVANTANWDVKPAKSMLTSNMSSKATDVVCPADQKCGDGGFLPFGFRGVLAGTAKCFYAYIGFESIASTGEEVVNPKRTIPLAIIFSLALVSVFYCGIASIITMVIPYFLIDSYAPISQAFEYANLHWAKTMANFGAIASLFACLFAGIFPIPRVIYSMANDGLIFKCLSKVLPERKTPANATIVAGVITSILCLFFELEQLIEMLSIGTLLAYSLVSTSVLIIRYTPNDQTDYYRPEVNVHNRVVAYIFGESDVPLFQRLFHPPPVCSLSTARLVRAITTLTVLDIILFDIVVTSEQSLSTGVLVFFLIVFLSLFVLFVVILWRQPQESSPECFHVPLLPLLPLISVTINLYLMLTLSLATWVRFLVWFALGLVIYFAYGVRNSVENTKSRNVWLPCLLVSEEDNQELVKIKQHRSPSTTEFDAVSNSGSVAGGGDNMMSYQVPQQQL